MSVQNYPNGIGGSAPGDSLDLARPLSTTGNIWYVSSLIGTDAASPAGQNREKPLATIAQAVTNAADDDIIVFLPGHTQTLTANQAIAKRLTLVGEGTTSGKPSVTFRIDMSNYGFTLSGSGIELRNMYFPACLQNNVIGKISITGTDASVLGCYFECGDTDKSPAVTIAGGADRPRIERSTFISTATLTSAQPQSAISGAVGTVVGLVMNSVVVSAGTVGFSNYSAIDLSTATFTRVKIEALSLLLGADMALGAGGTGRVNVQLATGGSRVSWG